jgi:hypothetical protein
LTNGGNDKQPEKMDQRVGKEFDVEDILAGQLGNDLAVALKNETAEPERS